MIALKRIILASKLKCIISIRIIMIILLVTVNKQYLEKDNCEEDHEKDIVVAMVLYS